MTPSVSNHPPALLLQVNEYQSKLRAATRKIMATVSELSMYQVRAGWGGMG
jgi:hypothetical protein